MVLRKSKCSIEAAVVGAVDVLRLCKLGRRSDGVVGECDIELFRASCAARASSLRAISSPLGISLLMPRRKDGGAMFGFVGDRPSRSPQARASKPSVLAGVSAPVPHGVGGEDVFGPESEVGAYMPESVELVKFSIDLDFAICPSPVCNESIDVLFACESAFAASMASDVGDRRFSCAGDGVEDGCNCGCES